MARYDKVKNLLEFWQVKRKKRITPFQPHTIVVKGDFFMCTAMTFTGVNHYFGRNLDVDDSYGEAVVMTPRNAPLVFRHTPDLPSHHAMLGMAHLAKGMPLYYDGVNEFGLCMAGLSFSDSCVYRQEEGKTALCSFELIPWILGQCRSVADARQLLAKLCITGENFDDTLPATPLHWMIADQDGCITVETVATGLQVYDNPVGVLTNNPPFPIQLFSLNNYFHCTAYPPCNLFSKELELQQYSRGLGGMGLPGDFSSQSRFVRGCFVKQNALQTKQEKQSVHQMFQMLSSVAQPLGCVRLEEEQYEMTRYSCCCNMEEGTYYYRTYFNSQITAVLFQKEEMDGDRIQEYPMRTQGEIYVEG